MLQDLFIPKKASEILEGNASNSPATQFFGDFIYSGEIAILFGDSNAGKTILANDIAFFTSGGGHEWDNYKTPNVPSMYIDMEMTSAQWAKRYSNALGYITDKYKRAEVDILSAGEESVLGVIKLNIMASQYFDNPPKFIVIDNITNGFGNMLSTTKARKFMSELKQFVKEYELTMLLVAHTPKRKPLTPITQDSMGGSKMLMNFCDSAFAIAQSSKGEDVRYIKQLKTRMGKKLQQVMSISITDTPYLSCRFDGWSDEESHLGGMKSHVKLTKENEIRVAMMLVQERKSLAQVSSETGISYDVLLEWSKDNNIINLVQ